MRRTATFPSLRVEPELRKAAEQSLRPGETLSAFLEAAVRETIDRRQAHDAFIARGLAARDRAKRSGHYRSSDEVFRHLERRLADARRRAKQRR
jgi:predicted transcriptional regulator